MDGWQVGDLAGVGWVDEANDDDQRLMIREDGGWWDPVLDEHWIDSSALYVIPLRGGLKAVPLAAVVVPADQERNEQ